MTFLGARTLPQVDNFAVYNTYIDNDQRPPLREICLKANIISQYSSLLDRKYTVKLSGSCLKEKDMKMGDGIGYYGLCKNSRYVLDPKKKFSSIKTGFVPLGRYGPFLPTDRKTVEEFELKSFIFQYSPEEWCFDVPETLRNRPQIIDITDDFTGDPHIEARRHIPMYVNETGYGCERTRQRYVVYY